jgi:hypothetical protein
VDDDDDDWWNGSVIAKRELGISSSLCKVTGRRRRNSKFLERFRRGRLQRTVMG